MKKIFPSVSDKEFEKNNYNIDSYKSLTAQYGEEILDLIKDKGHSTPVTTAHELKQAMTNSSTLGEFLEYYGFSKKIAKFAHSIWEPLMDKMDVGADTGKGPKSTDFLLGQKWENKKIKEIKDKAIPMHGSQGYSTSDLQNISAEILAAISWTMDNKGSKDQQWRKSVEIMKELFHKEDFKVINYDPDAFDKYKIASNIKPPIIR